MESKNYYSDITLISIRVMASAYPARNIFRISCENHPTFISLKENLCGDYVYLNLRVSIFYLRGRPK